MISVLKYDYVLANYYKYLNSSKTLDKTFEFKSAIK